MPHAEAKAEVRLKLRARARAHERNACQQALRLPRAYEKLVERDTEGCPRAAEREQPRPERGRERERSPKASVLRENL